MSKKVETLHSYSPEPGSTLEKIVEVDTLERAEEIDEELSGVGSPEKRDELEELANDEHREKVYIQKARKQGDNRDEKTLRDEFVRLQEDIQEYQAQRKADGTWTNVWDMTIDYMKENDKAFVAYLAKCQEENPDVQPYNVYVDYLNGVDLED